MRSLAIGLGCIVGNLMIAVAAAIGAQARVPGMVLLRAPLGRKGSYLPTAVNVVQCLGWTIFELIVIATAASALSDELFGFEAKWAWTLLFGALALVLGLLGPIGVVRRYIRTVAVWVVPARDRLPDLVGAATTRTSARSGTGPAGRALGLAGRRHRRRRHRLLDPARGRLHALLPRRPQRLLGRRHRVPRARRMAARARRRALLLPRPRRRRRRSPRRSRPAALLAFVALLALTVAETDEAFANAYSGAVSLQNLVPGVPQRALVVLTTALGTIGALTIDLVSYQSFLLPARLVLRAVVRGAPLPTGCSPTVATRGPTSSPRQRGAAGRLPRGSAGSRSTSGSTRPALAGGSISSIVSIRRRGASGPRSRASSSSFAVAALVGVLARRPAAGAAEA